MKRAQGKQNKDQTLGMESSVRCRVPHPWATSLTQLQRSEQRHKNRSRPQNLRMPTLLKRLSCWLCSPRGAKAESLLVLNYSPSTAPSLGEPACGTHLLSEELQERLHRNTQGFTGRHTQDS